MNILFEDEHRFLRNFANTENEILQNQKEIEKIKIKIKKQNGITDDDKQIMENMKTNLQKCTQRMQMLGIMISEYERRIAEYKILNDFENSDTNATIEVFMKVQNF